MAKFQIQKSYGINNYFFHLRATGNNEIILRSEGYTSKAACITGIESVKTHAIYDSRYDKEYSSNRQYYFNLRSFNGEIIGTSETYTTSTARDQGIALVKSQAPTATVEDLVGQFI